MTVELAGLLIALFSFAIAAIALLRTVIASAPSVDLVARPTKYDESVEFLINIQNPTRRSILVERVSVVEPDRNEVFVGPKDMTMTGTIRRAIADEKVSNSTLYSVFILIPPSESRTLHVHFLVEPDDGFTHGFFCYFIWSRTINKIERMFYPNKLKYSKEDLDGLVIAADSIAESE